MVKRFATSHGCTTVFTDLGLELTAEVPTEINPADVARVQQAPNVEVTETHEED
jgi:hypothetical protein